MSKRSVLESRVFVAAGYNAPWQEFNYNKSKHNM